MVKISLERVAHLSILMVRTFHKAASEVLPPQEATRVVNMFVQELISNDHYGKTATAANHLRSRQEHLVWRLIWLSHRANRPAPVCSHSYYLNFRRSFAKRDPRFEAEYRKVLKQYKSRRDHFLPPPHPDDIARYKPRCR